MIRLGTSGYSYDDWKGVFYPVGVEKRNYLSYYAQLFDTVEIDATYYRIPSSSMFEAIARKVPHGFRFCVKTPSTFTHERTKFEETLEPYRMSVYPLVRRRMLGCYLAQFPFSFKYTEENLHYLSEISASLEGPLCVEFRNSSWQNETVYKYLKEMRIGYVNVDLPRLPGLPKSSSVLTADIAYVRFHGRVPGNSWWNPKEPYERYNYEYREEELGEWVPTIRHLDSEAKETYAMFNNHFRAKAVGGARVLAKLLNVETTAGFKQLMFDS